MDKALRNTIKELKDNVHGIKRVFKGYVQGKKRTVVFDEMTDDNIMLLSRLENILNLFAKETEKKKNEE